MHYSSPHKFHIPVMGLAYTIDTPIKVARFGISSVISIVEDRLIEMMRSHYYSVINKEYLPINTSETDYRAKRITDYLNLVNKIVQIQIEKLRNAAFEAGSEIVKYFEMLPDDSKLKRVYLQMMSTSNHIDKSKLESYLRTQIKPGNIDVNIMTKTDKDNFQKNGTLLEEGSDAVSALRGFAKSDLYNSSVIFSAGMNPRLYNYLGNCEEFDVNEDGVFEKKVVVKVSDYRSAFIQGKYLAKKGVWVSEFRIESGLNCGGHAFATEGMLLGPILEEFKQKKQELIDTLFEIYKVSMIKRSSIKLRYPPKMILSVQGGIGTHDEDEVLHTYYNMDSTGWGTPFLLVPEATTVDQKTLTLLSEAKKEDVVLSRNSPLGVRFHYLKNTSAEVEKLLRIKNGKPGSPCTEKHLAFNTEFTTEPICTASHKYQKLKIKQLASQQLPDAEYQQKLKEVFDKECLCIGLSNAAAINYSKTFIKNLHAVTICPGPNIVNFSKVVSLQTMTDHIYGRTNIVTNFNRPNMFIAELLLYIDYIKKEIIVDFISEDFAKKKKFYISFLQNISNGIAYYQKNSFISDSKEIDFNRALLKAETAIKTIQRIYQLAPEENILNYSV